MNNDLIVERLVHRHHQALLREAETYRKHQPAVAMKYAGRMRKLLLALICALPLALLVARAAAGG